MQQIILLVREIKTAEEREQVRADIDDGTATSSLFYPYLDPLRSEGFTAGELLVIDGEKMHHTVVNYEGDGGGSYLGGFVRSCTRS